MPRSELKRGRDGRRMNPRSLANLKRGQNPAPPGTQLARTHGGYAAITAEERDDELRRIHEALAADAPLRAPNGDLPAADTVAVELLADCLVALRRVRADVSEHGWKERKSGEARPAVELMIRLRKEAADHLDALGMTTRSRARLGLDLVRGADLSTALSEPDPDRRRQLLVEAGWEEDGGG